MSDKSPPTKLQSCGYVIACDRSNHVVAASENLITALELDSEEQLLGRPIGELLPDVAPALDDDQGRDGYRSINLLTGRFPARIGDNIPTWVRLCSPEIAKPSGIWRILEIKPEERGVEQSSVLAALAATAHVCREATDTADLATGVTTAIRACFECERVSFCRFDHGGLAHVIAEDRSDDIESCLGLTFQPQAFGPHQRKLLLTNRVIFEANHGAAPIQMLGTPLQERDAERLSLLSWDDTLSKTMLHTGARTTLALAIILRGRLFGMVLCSYKEPRLPGVSVRHAAVTFGHLLSSGVDQVWHREYDRRSSETRTVRRALLASFDAQKDLEGLLGQHAQQLCELLSASNVLYITDEDTHQYPQPHAQIPREQLGQLAAHLRHSLKDGEDFYQTASLLSDLPELNVVRGVAAGVYALRLPESIVALLRPELIRSPRWVGDADAVTPTKGTGRNRRHISSEHSIVRGSSAPWSDEEVSFIEEIRDDLLHFEVERMQRKAEEMRSSMRQAEELEALVAQLSHELRNPMNPILGWSERLLAGEFDREEAIIGLRAIRRNARVQARLIENLFDSTRIKLGSMSVTRESVDLQNIIQTAIDVVERAARKKRIVIELDVDPSVRKVLLDRARMSQVFWNLLSNAVGHCPPDSKVWVTAARVDKTLVIEVEDTGPGVDPIALNAIFDRFAQTSAGREPHQGLGLGLAIVKGIVELHGGHISAENTGKGLRFRLEMPLLTSATHKTVKGEPEGPLSGYRIMLVDDAEDSLELAAAVLRGKGADLQMFTSAPSALESLNGEIDVLISDLGMPEMHGLDFIAKVRERGHTMPAIALTAYRATKDRIASLKAGFQMHLGKPISNEELVLSVLQLVGMASSRRG